ncbi:CMRF35-like molecule 9 isoform X1 [Cynocephalus volans]|uniref:CMRF35-like molecule 9 isoform X1 n=1 Tax=Cynocephalus volans TaxID=110931 RepID=UPI002FC8153F
MRPLILLWGCLVLPGYEALEGPKEISGFEGDTVSLQCTYSDELRENRKYWCKEGWLLFSHCSGTIYVGADGQEVTEGRVSIRDSRQELQFTVTLRDLTLQDAGEYRCGVQRLGLDETFLVSLLVSPGPCCPPSPTASFQLLATRSLQPRAKAWQTQPPELTSPGRHRAVTTAKQGKTVAKASPFTGSLPSGFAGTSPYARTSPYAGISRPAVQLDSTSAKHTSPVPSSGSSKPRVSIPMVHILAPVLVLLTLLLAAGLITFGSYWLRWRKKAQLAAETQRNKKVFLSHMTTEEEEASPQDPKGDILPVPPVHMAEEEMGFSKFTSV